MKAIKLAGLLCLIFLAVVMLGACSHSSYQDGEYYAEAPEFAASGWKETVEVTVVKGEIKKINWDAIYKDNSIPIHKKQYSKSGLYGMLAGGASEEWYDQAKAAEKFVLENGAGALDVNDEGYTDAVAGCTIHVNEFERLLLECLEQAKK